MHFPISREQWADFEQKISLLHRYNQRKSYYKLAQVRLFDEIHEVSKQLTIGRIRLPLEITTSGYSRWIRAMVLRDKPHMSFAILQDGTAAFREIDGSHYFRIERRTVPKEVFKEANVVIDKYLELLDDPIVREFL